MNEQDLLSTVKAKCQLVIILCTIMVSADVLILLVCLLHQEPLQIGVGLLLLNGLILITIWLALFKPFLGLISEKEQQYKTETAQLGTQIQQYKLSVAEGDLIRSIILSVSESSNYDTAIYQFIKHICDSTGWIFAQNWNFSEDSGAVHCGKIWYSRLDHFKWFRRSNEGIVFRSGEGLPGRVLKSKQAIWISDIQSESIFLRQEISAHANFRSAIAVPILVEDQIITIIEFFSVTQVEADEKHLQLVTDVASLLGLVFTQKLARQALERSEERYRIIAESTNDIIWDWDFSTDTVNYSLSLSSRLGYSPKNTDLKMVKDGFQLPLMWWYEHIHPEDVNRVFVKITESIYSCEPYWADEYRIRRADGTYMITLDRGSVVYDETGRPVRMVGVMMDITTLRETEEALRESHNYLESCVEQRTQELQELNRKLNQELIERKLLENQLVQSQKLESLGMLTAGIAHEINNPIGYVSGNLAVMKRYLSSLKEVIDLYRQFVSEQVHDESAKETFYIQLESICSLNKLDFMLEDSINIISESQDGARRVKEIVESLRGFSRMDHSEVLEANINQCLDSALRIVWNELKYKCVIAKDYQPLPNILCYAGQLNQVFMNLLVNAAQSIEERGIITLKTYVMDGFIVVQCTDTGCGIPPEQLPFIFDPFYTTKPVGQGTGLGLSISYGIIQRHQGKINVESTVGVGTTFTITLPLNGVADQSEPSMGTAA